MPLGIIDVTHHERLAGTEMLIGGDRPSVVQDLDLDTSQLKTVMHRGVETILIPQPSEDDPNDPLLWPRWKKETAFFVLFVNTIIFATLPGPVMAPATFALAGILNVPLTKIAVLSGYQLLIVAALGPFVSVLAQKYGKRPQFLFACATGTLGTIICMVGSNQTKYDTLLAGRIVQGLGVTAWESLSLAALGDIFYLHERGLRTAILVATLACMASLVAIIGAVMTERVGWRYMFTASLPFDIAGLLATMFLLPETQYLRSSTIARRAASLAGVSKDQEKSVEMDEGQHQNAEAANPRDAPPRKTYLQSLAPYSGTVYTSKNILHLLSEIFIHLSNPAVIWILLVSGVLISLYVVTAYITSQIWSVPPYNLGVAANGYFYTGGLVGGLCAIMAGPMCDWSARQLAKRNGGLFEAEFRIPVNILGVVFAALGWFLFMWDVEHPRPDGYYLGAFCHGAICFAISVPSTSAGLYILDSFPKQSTEVFVLQMMLKNFLFYGFSTFINTWAGQKGAGTVFRTFGIVSLCLLATCIPMYIFGKLNRKLMHDVHRRFWIFKALA
ncbi:uncharacterized protein E0L32_009669 [Thyridium curvatum]|uniref:Major facilitator superfamily (MFS) profile domain-containing protein n=1 Tax=Thyridium curvatum TaxID=1093900 RepID=A0A507AVA4_9PEZI|nr:uncharacterized protein E0L32_009669 [Thyridium curvatum]TPX08851.1 hypothetical protein E0L32_009669 [Thyridium curvatum]